MKLLEKVSSKKERWNNMNGQSNILENNLATLTREIEIITQFRDKQPAWSMKRHQTEDLLLDLKQERDKILEIKNAKVNL